VIMVYLDLILQFRVIFHSVVNLCKFWVRVVMMGRIRALVKNQVKYLRELIGLDISKSIWPCPKKVQEEENNSFMQFNCTRHDTKHTGVQSITSG